MIVKQDLPTELRRRAVQAVRSSSATTIHCLSNIYELYMWIQYCDVTEKPEFDAETGLLYFWYFADNTLHVHFTFEYMTFTFRVLLYCCFHVRHHNVSICSPVTRFVPLIKDVWGEEKSASFQKEAAAQLKFHIICAIPTVNGDEVLILFSTSHKLFPNLWETLMPEWEVNSQNSLHYCSVVGGEMSATQIRSWCFTATVALQQPPGAPPPPAAAITLSK